MEDNLSLINGLTFAVKKQGYDIDIAHISLEAEKLWEHGKKRMRNMAVTETINEM